MSPHRVPESADAARVAALVGEAFGVLPVASRWLGSHEDLNVWLRDDEGREWVAKVAAHGTEADAVAARLGAVAALGERVPVPRVARTPRGEVVVTVHVDGQERVASLVEFVPGRLVTALPRPPEHFAAQLGQTVAAMTTALAHLPAEASAPLAGGGPWDLREAPREVAAAAHALEEAEAGVVNAALAHAWPRVAARAAGLPVQPIHGDLTGDNVVLGDDGTIAGVIDFGDLGMGWRVAELATAMASVLHHDGDAVGLALDVARAADARSPLTDAELAVLWPLVVARGCVLVASAAVVAAAAPHNAYSAARRPLERRILERACGLDLDEAELILRATLGRVATGGVATPDEAKPRAEALVGLTRAVRVPLGVDAPVYDGGAFAHEHAAHAALAEAAFVHGVAFASHGERRLTPDALGGDAPRSLALGVELAVARGTPMAAPVPARVVTASDERLVLTIADGSELVIEGLEVTVRTGQELAAGDELGVVGASSGPSVGLVWVQRVAPVPGREPGARVPRWGHPARAAAWALACPDPSALLGLPPASAAGQDDRDALDVLAVRHDHVAGVQEHYYAAPPRIERGWRHHLIDTDGRGYLDMINNVAILGHGEPRLADVAAAQWRRLNTNSRFHYAAIADFSEQLAARAPEGLDAVLLVNSGSEAVDLALRIARAATGRGDVLALTEAYHGWTVGADAVSTSLGDNPGALGSRPEWVHLLDAPNTYRGTHRGADGYRYLADALARLEELDARGVALAGVIAEPIFGNGGGILLPEGYLAGVFDAVRERGGLAISDEVQVSYGRLGEHFWGFEQQGAVPDVITVAKAMGNGQPLGAVITTRAIAEAFAVEGSFFSSSGGSPVSCVIGAEVLRILDEDGLQENARVMGALLRDGLLSASAAHSALGTVHGIGLYLGVEVVAGGPDAPDPVAARQICDALLDEGVIVQPTGDHKNVLKIKPPLTIDAAAVERFLVALDRVMMLREARAAL